MKIRGTGGEKTGLKGATVTALSVLLIIAFGCSSAQVRDPADGPAPEGAQEVAEETEGSIEPEAVNEDSDPPVDHTYRIEIGDVFDVKVYNHEELGENLVVRPDGKISMLLAEEIQAAGLTPPELDRIITEQYSRRLTDPEITIIMRNFAGNRVYVGGEVNKPTEVLIEGRLTLIQAIYMAGGFKDTAKLKSVVLLRDKGTDMPDVILVDVDKVLARGEGDIPLIPYDAIFVPKTIIAKADKLVDQYINKIVPRNLTASFAWTYDLNPWIEVFSR